MSFILDALKKSENDRQRQTGPALFEVRVPPPRSRLPLLAIAVVALLVVNLGVVGWLTLRKPAEAAVPSASPPAAQIADATPAGPASTAQAPTNGAPAAQAQVPTPTAQPPQGANAVPPMPAQTGPAQQAYYGNGAPPPSYPPAGGTQAPQGYAGGYAPPPSYPAPPAGYDSRGEYTAPPPAARYEQYPPQARGADPMLSQEPPVAPSYNPDDYAPAQEPQLPQPGTLGHVTRMTEYGLPTYAEASSRTSMPPLHMDLHSYAAEPAKRFVLINMKRLYEGQSLPEGVKVESITNDAAIMSYNGSRFVLSRD